MRALMFVVLSLVAAPAMAQNAALDQAARAYGQGVEAFKRGDFPTALSFFERAYKLDPAPILIYNLARAHEEMGHAAKAIDHFELYLTRVPDAPDRADVERRTRVMKKILEQVHQAPPPVEPAPSAPRAPPPPARGARTLRPYAYGALGVGAAALGAGVYFVVQVSSAEDEHAAATTGRAKASSADAAHRAALGANLSYGLAGAALVAGGVLWLLEPDLEISPAVAVSPRGGLVGLSGRF